MTLRQLIGFIATALLLVLALAIGQRLWVHYMDEPWTRDGRVRAQIVNIAPDVSGAIVELPVADNMLVKKGQVLMRIDPSHYQVAVEQAEAQVAARRAEWQMRRAEAARRADMDSLVVSKENRENASSAATAAQAQYQQAVAALDAAKLNLSRTTVISPVNGYVTNLSVFRGDYATAGTPKLAIVDSHSFWVYGYFEETKLPRVKVGDPAQIRLMSGGVLQGHVESISRGIYDRDNPQSRELVADVNPTFNWVRLAQRVPVRIHIDSVPNDIVLAAGTTCTVVVSPAARPASNAARHPGNAVR
ncbi:HlyD family secretion protein [Trinickia diaoshuihuensis]|uniref:efflux RND transporter periplasmic adaptor subunit n=1 Tax=Trinickia diaoshuihuensis TaxID=2292265 RepID=UPI000E2427F6|nr:HlyD family secretion protein [Trinickia diaoshuihuensis]